MEKMFEEITIAGAPVLLEHRDIPLSDMELDEDNPRLRYLSSNKKDKALEEFIRDMPDASKLRKDIEQNGGLRERIIVRKNGNGKFKAAEGNRRTVAYKDLGKQHPKDQRWKNIPARVLPDEVDEKKLAVLLSSLHVAGKVEWGAHEKAGQVYHMNKVLHIPLDQIVILLHVSKSTVKRWLDAYSFMIERFLVVDDAKYHDKGDGKWSWFDELYRSKELKKFMDEDQKFADNFCRWVGDGRLAKGADVRKLAVVLQHPEARAAFEKKPAKTAFADALRIVSSTDPEQDSDFFKLLAKVRDNCSSAAQVKEILRIRSDKAARKRVLETYTAFVDFMRLADVDPEEAG